MKTNDFYGKLKKRMGKDLKTLKLDELASRIGISYISLWRIVNGKTKGSFDNWRRIVSYYERKP